MDWHEQMLEAFSDYWTDYLDRQVVVVDIYESASHCAQVETTFYFDDRSVKDYEGSLSEFIEELNE